MKHLLGFTAVALFSTQAFAGFILPDLSRSKSTPNLSPIAVGFSERNAATLALDHLGQKVTIDGGGSYEQNTKSATGLLFYSNPSVHFEAEFNISKEESDYENPQLLDIDGSAYDIKGTIAAPFTESVRAGISVETEKTTSNYSVTRSETKTLNITPGIGFKLQPQVAIGFGLEHRKKSTKETFGNVVTNYPDLKTNTLFAGVAYGVDQKIGEDGFGIEAVVTHTPKEKSEINASISLASGRTTSLIISGNYIFDKIDVSLLSMLSTGKNYDETTTTDSQVVVLRSEFMIASPYYLTPQLSFIHSKDKSTTGTDTNFNFKSFGYGLSAGMRVAQYDVSLGYTHLDSKSTAVGFKNVGNQIFGKFSFYF